ncbi:hypothetical protein Tco_0784624 [Tanacetum coccineum]
MRGSVEGRADLEEAVGDEREGLLCGECLIGGCKDIFMREMRTPLYRDNRDTLYTHDQTLVWRTYEQTAEKLFPKLGAIFDDVLGYGV